MTDTELEDQLTALFDRRAAEVKAAPAIELPDSGQGRMRLNLTPFAIAASIAAVVLVAGGSVVGIRSLHHPASTSSAATHAVSTKPTPSARPTNCRQIEDGTTWQAPIHNGIKVVLDHPDNQVVSVNGNTGEFLLLQSTPNSAQTSAVYGQATLAIFRGSTGQDIAELPAGSIDLPGADPAGAISTDWIAYSLARPQNGGTYYKVMLYDRHTRTTSTIDQLDDSALLGGTIFSGQPVIFGHTVYWIQSVYSDRSKSVLKSYDLQTGVRGSAAVPGAISLVYYGTGLATVAGNDSNSIFTTRVGAHLPEDTLAALQGASTYAFNAPTAATGGAGSLAWVKTIMEGGQARSRYYQLPDVGKSGLSSYESSQYVFDLIIGTGPFAPAEVLGTSSDGSARVLDARPASDRVHQLPAGDTLQAVVGDTAIFGAGSNKLGASSLVLVKVENLPKQTAGC